MAIQIRRRQFISTLGGAIAWPLAAHAQHAKVPTLGVLLTGNPPPEVFLHGFAMPFRSLVYADGQGIRLEE